MENYKNLWEVAVLALLREAPMHPYQMQKLLHDRHKAELLALKKGSLYHAINRLMREGLIEASDTGRSGRRPERTTYRITAEGHAELIDVLRRMIGIPRHESSDFMAALSFLLHLDRDDALKRLEERSEQVEKDVQALQSGMKAAAERVDRINLIEGEYLLAMRRAELKWVRRVIDEMRSGQMTWDMKKIFREARTERVSSAKEKRR